MKIQPKSYLYYMTSVLCSTASLSAGGLYLYELSTTETSMAGAGWAARAQDPATIVTNPAGMSRLDGTQIQFTAQPLAIDSSFSSDQGGGSDLNSYCPAVVSSPPINSMINGASAFPWLVFLVSAWTTILAGKVATI